MNFIQKIIDFFRNILMKVFRIKPATDEQFPTDLAEQTTVEEAKKQQKEEKTPKSGVPPEEKQEEMSFINSAIYGLRSSMLDRLYALEQEIAIFEKDFPEEYKTFSERIKLLQQDYYFSLEEIKKSLTFAIDPDTNWAKKQEVDDLAKDIRYFIEKEVKFRILVSRIGRLIVKLNILYNVSIVHTKKGDVQKANSQLERAKETQVGLVQEVKQSEYIMQDKQFRQRLLELMCYADYLIFKASIRNFGKSPNELIEELVMPIHFKGYDYIEAFKSFVKDEIYDLAELLELVEDKACQKMLREDGKNLVLTLAYAKDMEAKIKDSTLWYEFLGYEANLLEMLKESKVDREKRKVKLIARMDIRVEEDDVLVAPVTNAYLSLTRVFSETHDNRVLVLLKVVKQLPKEVTYKEIYFLALLFDATQVIQSVPNDLARFISRYQEKYAYTAREIEQKKQAVMQLPNKEYVTIFSLDEYTKQVIRSLEKLNIDFQVLGDKVVINSFYFNGLENVQTFLQATT
ncbi:MAG: hypothetical protein HFJ28_06990 [Clostridia bacterium]|nr:hypothetical protein [Clostridia bacterium]